MTTTASNFYNKIDVNYPTQGKDNDSQGFRNNFANIKNSLSVTDGILSNIELNMVTTTATNNFGFNTIKRANFQDCSTQVYDDSSNIRSQAVSVNYSDGSYQKFKIADGNTTFTVINWPSKFSNLKGSIILSIEPVGFGSVIDFFNATAVGATSLPFTFGNALPAFFEIWSDDGGTTVYVNQIGYKTGVATSGTVLIAYDSLRIDTNTYRIGDNFNTVVSASTGTSTYVGNVALLPNTYTATLTTSSYENALTPNNYFTVLDGSGVYNGAIVSFTGTNTTYTVDHIEYLNSSTTAATIYTKTNFDLKVAYGTVPSTSPSDPLPSVLFSNAVFENQPLVITFRNRVLTSNTGTTGDFKGHVYANSSSLYFAYDDYGNTTTNWLKFYDSKYIDSQVDNVNTPHQLATGTTAITVSTDTNSQVLATTQFVHNILPKQSIIMWGGRPSQIPYGWHLCDGTTANGVTTPDLRNKFIIGASTSTGLTPVTTIEGSPTTIGGNKNATLVEHNHIATIDDQGHRHSYINPQLPSPGNTSYQNGPQATTWRAEGIVEDYTNTATTNINVSISLEGDVADNANLPPYYALCYIMKVI